MRADAAVGWTLAALLLALALIGPLVTADPLVMADAESRLRPPSSAHLLGTDQFARDIFSRLAHGAATSLQVAGVAVLVAGLIGTMIGVGAGAAGSRIGGLLRRLIDLALALPRMVILLVLLSTPAPFSVVFAFGSAGRGGPRFARLYAERRCDSEGRLVLAAQALGAAPNRGCGVRPSAHSHPPRRGVTGVADAVLLEAGLRFCLGIRAPARRGWDDRSRAIISRWHRGSSRPRRAWWPHIRSTLLVSRWTHPPPDSRMPIAEVADGGSPSRAAGRSRSCCDDVTFSLSRGELLAWSASRVAARA